VTIPKSLTINGAGASKTIVDGNKKGSTFKILNKDKFNAKINVYLSGMLIRNGKASVGGGIMNGGRLYLSNCRIAGNSADYDGGGIYSEGTRFIPAILRIANSTISGNTAMAGCGIYNGCNATITGSSISGNAENSAGKGMGGGIFNGGTIQVGTKNLIVTGGSITGNKAGYGAGIYSQNPVTLTDADISSNTAIHGGGILNSNGDLLITGTTKISSNLAATGYGGGIYLTSGSMVFDGKNIAIKTNKAHLPNSEESWFKGWGVYLLTGTPTTKNGFNAKMQVNGNTHI